VVMASKGYPGPYEKGYTIKGLAEAEKVADVKVFHAGTRRDGDAWRVSGGRAAYLTAWAATMTQARASLETALHQLSGSGWRCRTDIAERIPNDTGVA